jgi:PKD repeat protein
MTVQCSVSSSANVRSGAAYLWTWGDGSTSSTKSGVHTYVASGDYTVSLKVTNLDGKSGSDQTLVIVP